MKVVIDTYNALHITGILPPELAGLDAPGLVDLMARGRWSRNQVLLVCDGVLPRGHRDVRRGGIGTIHSGADKEADDIIEEIIERTDAPLRMLVISSDQRVVRAAKRRRCRTMSSEAFLRTLVHDHERARHQGKQRRDAARPAGKLSRKSVDEWRTQFDIDDEDMAEFTRLDKESRSRAKKMNGPPAKPKPPRQTTSPTQPDPPLPDHIIEEAMRMLDEDVS
ncbi:MAG: hypothetical protein CMJ36_05095 [Phycisphaerae bacterium]|mgnify:CR=1 FL=1|nr:hypothetical protein [Phycisphaerae bacterium]